MWELAEVWVVSPLKISSKDSQTGRKSNCGREYKTKEETVFCDLNYSKLM